MDLCDDTMTKMKYLPLPHELVTEVLSWLPVEYLSPLRFVSKPWFHLLTGDPQFAKLHFDRSIQLSTNPSILATREINYQGKSNFYLATDHTACNKAIKLKQSPSDEHYNYAPDYVVSGICNGLLCVFLHGGSEVYIWNPLTGDHITIPYSPKSQRFSDPTSFAFGYHPATDEYKVIKVLTEYDAHDGYRSQVSVYTLGVDSSWRIVEEDVLYQMTHLDKPGPVINGAVHWVARNEVIGPFSEIAAFDLTNESVQMIGCPKQATSDAYMYITYLIELDGLLCLFLEVPDMMQIWTMKEYGVVISWTQQFNVRISELGSIFTDMEPLATVAHNGDFILREGSAKLVLYNPKNNSIKKLKNFCIEIRDAYSYIGSILSPKVISGAARI